MSLRLTTTYWGCAALLGTLLPVVGFLQTPQEKSVPSAATETTYETAWTADIGDGGPVDVTIAGTAVLLTGGAKPLEALSLDDGHPLWSSETTVTRPLIVAGTTAFALTADDLVAFDPATGRESWRTPLSSGSSPCSSAVHAPAPAASIVVSCPDGLRSYAVQDGVLQWRAGLPFATVSDTAVDAGLLFVGLENNSLLALDLASHTIRWTQSLASTARWLTAANERVYVGQSDGQLAVFRQKDGEFDWALRRRPTMWSPPATDAERVYLALADGSVLGLGGRKGQQIWSLALPARPKGLITIVDGRVFVATDTGDIMSAPVAIGRPAITIPVSATTPKDALPELRLEGHAMTTTGDVFVRVTKPTVGTTRTVVATRRVVK